MQEGPRSAAIYSFPVSREHVLPKCFLVTACGLVLGGLLMTNNAVAQVRPANDNFANAIQLVGTNLTAHGSNVNATKERGEPNHAGQPGGKSVWWFWKAPETGYATVSTLGSI